MAKQKSDGYFAAKVDEVGYPLGDGDRSIDQSKDVLKSILKDDVSSDSDGEVDDV